ncbi:hemophore [Candidatus Mycobacterium wuenschmannii]|uniref:Hemophore n=1 Tax=Candidatus Mycobacterium wuenschmannii TaxID=3027808 RepID=A0ABY8VTP5_9MYCO|nr:hemophore [Candidatus Mycobacterium wuenschmannii]WIM87005.1 hemophore [Candidatus Mycobacterium wuenschmannii]
MTSLTGSSATLRRRLLAALTATGMGGAAAVVMLSAPSAVGAPDPCSASEMARTISNVARSAGDYLDGHPETNQAMTTALLQPAGPAAAETLRVYLGANPKAAGDLSTIAQPLAGMANRCQTPQISFPQVLGFPQFALSGPPATGVPPQAAPTSPAVPPVSNTVPGVRGQLVR